MTTSGRGSTDDETDPPSGPDLQIPSVLREDGPPLPKISKPEPGLMASMADVGKAWAVALDFIVTILMGAGAGYGWDRWRSTSPTGILIGLSAGFAFALVRIIRYTQKQEALERAERAKRPGERTSGR